MAGPATRTRDMQRRYVEYLATRSKDVCIFCHIQSEQAETIIEETAKMLVVTNRFGYSVWEGCAVTDHLMVIPKKHRSAIGDFKEEEKREWLNLCLQYEAQGYSLYTRSPDNITKSIAHHHTHFIKLDNKRKSFMVYLRKPHLLITR